MSAALSRRGLEKVQQIMEFDEILKTTEGNGPARGRGGPPGGRGGNGGNGGQMLGAESDKGLALLNSLDGTSVSKPF